jgi:hypothetical protein
MNNFVKKCGEEIKGPSPHISIQILFLDTDQINIRSSNTLNILSTIIDQIDNSCYY